VHNSTRRPGTGGKGSLRSKSSQPSAKRRALLALSVLAGVLLLGARGAPSAGPELRGFLHHAAAPAATAVVPSGFSDEVAFSGLTFPTSVRFSPDGRVFVAEKSGLVKVFDGLDDTTPTEVVDLRTQVDDYWDRGLLGLALDPGFPTMPYVYLFYTYDAPPGGTAPTWNDACPTPPGPTTDGCVVTGKLVRVHLSGNTADATQTLIAGGWCQQYPSHSVGDLGFGPDGKLYATAGEGASWVFADYGQAGGSAGSPTPKNPCGDPPAGIGGSETPPSAQGGALRAQSPRRPGGPTLLSGSVLRLDPATGAPPADNPNPNPTDENLRRIIAYGLRNPFRFAFRPGTSELWVGDVGWATWEEIEKRPTPAGPVQNFGWPCYEGTAPQPAYQSAGLTLCANLYAAGTASPPFYKYDHSAAVEPGENCPTGNGSVISGLTFYGGGSYPSTYDGALVFADHSRNCIWTMSLGDNGQPDPSRLQALVEGAANPVDLETGPGGDLYYVDFDGGTIHHLSYSPVPGCAADRFRAQYYNNVALAGQPVLTRCETAINHDWGTGSPGPEVNADSFSASWSRDVALAPGTYTFTATTDDGIRVYVDGEAVIDEWHEQAPTTYTATVPVSDGTHHLRVEYYEDGNTAVAQVSWQLDTPDTPPAPVIDGPSPTLKYEVGDGIQFSGHATDAEDGTLPESALSWTLLIHHCTTPTQCHVHNVQSWAGAADGSFAAPDHDYPSHLELVLRATDALGVSATTSVTLDPRTVQLAFRTQPAGLALVVGSSSGAAPFTRTAIVGSQSAMSAPATQLLAGKVFRFASWSDGGAATHNFTAAATPATYTATYVAGVPPPPPSATSPPTLAGIARQGKTVQATPGTWSGSPVKLVYSWLRCDRRAAACAVIDGAGGSSYTLRAFDVGSRIIARITATNAGGSGSASSPATGVVTRAVRGTVRAAPRKHVRTRPRRHR
jgi:glucose/arabinose dehydrogenase